MVAWASVPIYYLVYVGAYYLGIVRGGADVKCLVVLSIIFPMYPYFTGLPLADVSPGLLSHVFVLSVSSLFLAAVLAIPIFVYFVVRNARAGIISRKMASGYRMDISKAEVAFVWPLEDIVEGELTYIKIPKDEDISGIYSRLKEAGHETVWVTPMIPFVVLITIAVAVIVLIGDPLFLIA
jgi:preflagellin peptidase FlaK